MALNWNLGKIENYIEVCMDTKTDEDGRETRTLKPVTNRLIWNCLSARMGKITEKNYKEFYARCLFLDKLWGVIGYERTTLADVRSHIGLTTNVTTESWSKFLAAIRKHIEADVEHELRMEAANSSTEPTN